jgi:hypothetical protein
LRHVLNSFDVDCDNPNGTSLCHLRSLSAKCFRLTSSGPKAEDDHSRLCQGNSVGKRKVFEVANVQYAVELAHVTKFEGPYELVPRPSAGSPTLLVVVSSDHQRWRGQDRKSRTPHRMFRQMDPNESELTYLLNPVYIHDLVAIL